MSDMGKNEDGALTFTTTNIGDIVRVGDKEYEVMQKYHLERRLILREMEGWKQKTTSMGEFDYNRANPVLVRGKVK